METLMLRTISFLFLVFVVTASVALGMGSDHKLGDLPQHDGWPSGVYEVVNQPNRVHGYWVNSSDTLFYRGTHSDLNKMIKALTAISAANVEIVLHTGLGIAKSPWAKKPVGLADWSIKIGKGGVTPKQDEITIDIWIGGGLSLAELEIPSSLTVKSGGEIEAFIRNHELPKSKD